MKQQEFYETYETIKRIIDNSNYKERVTRLDMTSGIGEPWKLNIRVEGEARKGALKPCLELVIPQKAAAEYDEESDRISIEWSGRRLNIGRRRIMCRLGDDIYFRLA